MKFKIESMYLAVIVTILFITALTIVSEIYSPLKDWLKTTFYHHWIGKSILALILFAVVSISPFGLSIKELEKYMIRTIWFSVLALFLYFIWHYFTA